MSELRYDLIQGRWVIIATDRSRRPHDLTTFVTETGPDSFCPFCPGHEERTPPEILAYGRPSEAAANGPEWQVRVIPNKYPALSVEGDLEPRAVGLFDRMRGVGAHEVIIDTPDHDGDLSTLPLDHMETLLSVCQERIRDLYRDRRLKYVLVFKNHGQVAGATLAHPHSQIIATPVIPRIVVQELNQARAHFSAKERCLFCDVWREEHERQERVVTENEHFIVIAPYASRFPFELMILPKRHHHEITAATPDEIVTLAKVLQDVAGRLKRVLDDPPFNLLIHTGPNTQAFRTRPDQWQTLASDFHWHLEILPRLIRVAGFETGTDFYINPTAPEEAARFLREASVETGSP